ncbi:MAG: hypothetical protein LBL84_03065 [Candidatus Nomurabacteria bacterium]|jgi:hypothetical protein|nr:hypothetical protein [Candidatus Nomurabacteria bacterium]
MIESLDKSAIRPVVKNSPTKGGDVMDVMYDAAKAVNILNAMTNGPGVTVTATRRTNFKTVRKVDIEFDINTWYADTVVLEAIEHNNALPNGIVFCNHEKVWRAGLISLYVNLGASLPRIEDAVRAILVTIVPKDDYIAVDIDTNPAP